jgi:hypothetical protein
MMKIVTTAAVALLFAVVAAADQPWDAAVEKAWQARELVPARIDTKTEIFDGDGTKLEIVTAVEHLDSWSAGEPVMKKAEQRTVIKKSGMSFGFKMGINANPLVAAHEGRVTHLRKGEQSVDGRACILYAFEERPADPKGQTWIGEAWIDPATGAAVKVAYRYKEPPKNVSAYELTIRYVLTDGRWTPATAHMDASGGFLFIKRTLKVDKTFADWTKRPAA